MKTISIVLTKYSDLLSSFICFCSGGGYTHVSLALDDEAEAMYSFNYRGFCIETMEKHRRRGVTKSRSYQLRIADDRYEALVRRIQYFVEHRKEFSYTRLGVMMCFLHVPFKRKQRYFCSQFVAESLALSGAFKLNKAPSLYLPRHLENEVAYSAQLLRIACNPV